ncbi:energy transducer TonB [bacterium]|nr:energy transducer TonB [bacterium]
MNEPKIPRLFPLGLIAALSITLASFEWTEMEWSEPAGWSYQATSLLEIEMAPVSVPSKPVPPPRPLIHPRIVTEPIVPNPTAPLPDPNPDIQLGPLHDFSSYGDGNGDGTEEFEIETVLLAEHMPRFASCTNVLNQDQERFCTESEMIRLIQSCAVFPRRLVDARVGGVVFLQFNVDEFGDVSSPSVLKSAHPDLDQAALEALNCLPQMIAGTQHGKPVRVTYTIPVRFTVR